MSVWYSPEWDEIRVADKTDGFLFKDEIGELHLCYRLTKPFKMSSFYYIGDL